MQSGFFRFGIMWAMGIIVSEEELKDHAFGFLGTKELMALATSYKDEPWATTVPFVAAPAFEIIFYSRPGSKHTENIEKNDRVSAVVTEIPVHNNKERSVQITGKVRKIDGVEWNTYYPLYESRFPEAKDYPDHIIYVLKPEEVWIIDEKIFGHKNRTRVI